MLWKGDPWALFSLMCTERRERHHLGDRVSAPTQLQASNGVTAQQQGSAQGGAGQWQPTQNMVAGDTNTAPGGRRGGLIPDLLPPHVNTHGARQRARAE